MEQQTDSTTSTNNDHDTATVTSTVGEDIRYIMRFLLSATPDEIAEIRESLG